jgi:hypothetical protein
MALIDDRGRLFGILNLVDALVGIVLLGLIPLAYGSFLLCRTPMPTITAIEPAQVVIGKTDAVRVTGTDIRPFLNARIGPLAAKAFLVQSPTEGEIKLPADLPPGTYDIGLYDEGQELVMKPGALTVVAQAPPPRPKLPQLTLQVTGTIVGLTRDPERTFAAGGAFRQAPPESGNGEAASAPVAEILASRAPEAGIERVRTSPQASQTQFIVVPVADRWRVPAILRVRCEFENGQCKVNGVEVSQNATLTLPWTRPRTASDVPPAEAGKPSFVTEDVRFLIDEVRAPEARPVFTTVRTAIATIQVRFMAPPEVADEMKAGDQDLGVPLSPTDERAVLVSLSSDRQTVTANQQLDATVRRHFQVPQTVQLFGATLRVPVTFKADGWNYKDRGVKVGAPFTFDSASQATAAGSSTSRSVK